MTEIKYYTIVNNPKTFHESFRIRSCGRRFIVENLEYSFTDITFIVDIDIVNITAHKAILAAASPVFAEMFFPGGEPIRMERLFIPDVNSERFKEMLNYIYCASYGLPIGDLVDACQLYNLAMVFKLPDLRNQCVNIIELILKEDPTNTQMWRPYDIALSFKDEKELLDKWLEVIKSYTREVLKSIDFWEVRWNTLDSILSCETLTCSEFELFEAVKDYAKGQNKKKNRIAECRNDVESYLGCSLLEISVSEHNIDKVLKPKFWSRAGTKSPETEEGTESAPEVTGESEDEANIRTLMKKIRFLTFTPEQFAEGPAKSGLLSDSEALAILVNIISDKAYVPMPEGFSTSKESRWQTSGQSSTQP